MSTYSLFLFITFVYLFTKTLCQQQPQPPDIFNIKDKSGAKTVGYKIVWEISDITGFNQTTNTDIGTSYSLTEYYDIVNRRGRLDFVKSNDVNGTFIYDAVTQETFFINGGTCTLGNINNKPPFLKRMIDDYWTAGFSMERTILGPSVFLRAILNNQQGIQWRPDFKNSPDKRYFNGNFWTANTGNGIMGWIFTSPTSPNPYGFQNMAIPILVSVGSYINNVYKKKKLYEVAQFTPYVNSTKKIISVPLGMGCGRNPAAIATAPKPPFLKSGFSYDMKLEIVMNPKYIRTGNDINPSNLVDNGRLTYDDTSKMMAWRYTGFNVTAGIVGSYYSEEHRKTAGLYYDDTTIDTGNNNVITDNGTLKGNELKNPSRTVWDLRAGIVYIIDDMNGGCTIKPKAPNDFLVSINFKAGYKIPINAPELLQNDGFLYMGEYFERGIPVIVYEKKVNKLIGFGKSNITRTVVFTHYFVKDNYANFSISNNMLLRIDISILNPININNVNAFQKIWSATINVNEFTINYPTIDIWSHVKQQVFNVKNCYLKRGLSKWFQLGFPITNTQFIKLYQQADTIDRSILNYLFTADDLSIAPTRIPTSLIGWSKNTLYFSALMLERAPFSLDFHVIKNGTQRLKRFSKQVLVQSPQDCAGRCLDLDTQCNFYSLCSNFMCILGDFSLDPSQMPEMVLNNAYNCTTYQKNPKSYSMLTMNSILTKIQSKVKIQPKNTLTIPIRPLAFTLYITSTNGLLENMTLTAVQFKSGFGFGQTNTFDGQIILNNDRYKLRSSSHFKKSNDKRLTQVMASSYLSCQQKCDDFHNNTCHSFSFCPSNQECILSTLHAEEMIDQTFNNLYEPKSGCALLYRYYISEYTRFGRGVITTRTAAKSLKVMDIEECAFACSNENTFKCKSFDSCGSDDGPTPQYNCFLHRLHILDNKITESIQLKLDPTYVHCGHYSRNYASDFRNRPNMNYANIDGKNRIKLIGLTVEQCAKQCVETQSKRKCLGFSYCQGRLISSIKPQASCVLSPTNDQNNTVNYITDQDCEIYFNGALNFRLVAKPITVTNSPLIPNINPTINPNTNPYSSAAGAGLGIFMLLLGGFLAVVGIIVYNKRKAALNGV